MERGHCWKPGRPQRSPKSRRSPFSPLDTVVSDQRAYHRDGVLGTEVPGSAMYHHYLLQRDTPGKIVSISYLITCWGNHFQWYFRLPCTNHEFWQSQSSGNFRVALLIERFRRVHFAFEKYFAPCPKRFAYVRMQ